MAPGSFRFDRFRLDLGDRQLWRDGVRVELNARYLDALALLVREQGRLVSKDRFHEEVWRGAPVTDEALTQCIRTLRRQLGDDAARPRFIETAPKHGYRFIAPVEDGELRVAPLALPTDASRRLLLLGGAGMAGGGAAGVLGGLFYGFAGASQASAGAASVLLVLACITMVLGLVAGAGVGLGVAAASLGSPRLGPWSIAGGAFGGMVVGAVVKLLGLDAFNLLFGQTPGDITGAAEGALLGGAVGVGVWLGSGGGLRRSLVAGGLAGAAVGVLIPLLGGRLLGGSLDLLARSFPHSRLPIGGLFGEGDFGPLTQGVTGALEGALFAACTVGALALAWRRLAGVAEQRGRAEP